MKRLLLLSALLLTCKPPTIEHPPKETPTTKPSPLELSSLQQGQRAHGFKALSLYQDEQERPMGARFIHEATGFTLDLLQLQSSPQAFVWVDSLPTSNKGEPHTQEHLLLGKGDKGRSLANAQVMSLTESSAFTMQQRTAYHFQTIAGAAIFYESFSTLIDALLHPDYTDEEIRREVRNFSVVEDAKTKSLRLEEQGTVYQEMSSTYAGPDSRLFDALGRLLYGPKHPLSFSSGGTPEALRTLTPEDIRRFHKNNYHLDQMGAIAALPKEMKLDDVLMHIDEALRKEGQRSPAKSIVEGQPLPGKPGEIKIVEYPNENEQQPGDLIFAWPPASLSARDRLLLSLFLSSFSGDATTNLYKLFVDTQSKKIETGAKGVYSFLDDESTEITPIYIGLSSVDPTHMNEAEIKKIRSMIRDELQRISALQPNDKELLELNERIKDQILETQRSLAELASTPPGFGFRNTGSGWLHHLDAINRQAGFVKSLTWQSDLKEINDLLQRGENPWKDALPRWGMLSVEPYAVGVRANPALLSKEDEALDERRQEETSRLMSQYKTTDAQAALAQYKADYDAATLALEAQAKKQEELRFIESPPLTLDDTIEYKVKELRDGVKIVASTFDSMPGATTGLAINLRGIPEEQLLYASMLPALLTRSGVIENGTPVSFEEMSERLRREVSSVTAYFDSDLRTRRIELVMRGVGNNLEESKNALSWMKLMLLTPDWRPENLPRMREVVDQSLNRLRERTLGPEESWVNDPADAYWVQDDPLLLSTSSFMTRSFQALRMRWILKDAGTKEEQAALQKFCADLLLVGFLKREDVKTFLTELTKRDEKLVRKPNPKIEPNQKQYVTASFDGLPITAKPLAKEFIGDLLQVLADIPDATLSVDFKQVTGILSKDLLTPPEVALESLTKIREGLLLTGNLRAFQVGAQSTQEALTKDLDGLLSVFRAGKMTPTTYSTKRIIEARMAEHTDKKMPLYVGLVSPSLQGGVFLHAVPSTSLLDEQREPLLRYLASRLYAGHGAHGLFMKTWGAGLAYSNGLRGAPQEGRLAYYAERTPLLPQTLEFVIKTLREAKPEPGLVEYAIAMVFQESLSAASYEHRGEQLARDITDGIGPEVVKKFRENILALRRDKDLAEELFSRAGQVYAELLPGYDNKVAVPKGAVYFVIGEERQLRSYEDYLKANVSADATLYRLYPRDFWLIPAK